MDGWQAKLNPELPLETGKNSGMYCRNRAVYIRVVDPWNAMPLSPGNKVVLDDSDLAQVLDISICAWLKGHVLGSHLRILLVLHREKFTAEQAMLAR